MRRDLGHLAADLDALWVLTKRNVTQAEATGVPGPGGSVFKLYYRRRATNWRRRDAHPRSRSTHTLDDDDPAAEHVRGWMHAMSITIAANESGSSNILGERVLGLLKN